MTKLLCLHVCFGLHSSLERGEGNSEIPLVWNW